MMKQGIVTLLISLCAVSLAFHFAVESRGGMIDHFIGDASQGLFDSHEGDQFVMSEAGNSGSIQTGIRFPLRSRLHGISRPPTPPFQPPKSA
jgi:hypothetical protein